MDKPHKRRQTSEDDAAPEAFVAPSQARSPYRPLSRRKRQEQVVEPPPAVERPVATQRFDVSPTRLSAALAKKGALPEEFLLVWRTGDEVEVEFEVEVEGPEIQG